VEVDQYPRPNLGNISNTKWFTSDASFDTWEESKTMSPAKLVERSYIEILNRLRHYLAPIRSVADRRPSKRSGYGSIKVNRVAGLRCRSAVSSISADENPEPTSITFAGVMAQ